MAQDIHIWEKEIYDWGELMKLNRREGEIKNNKEEFYPFGNFSQLEGSLAHTEDFELKYWIFQKNKNACHDEKKQKKSTEYTFLIKGRVKGWIKNKVGKKEEINMNSGDCIIIKPGYCSNLVEEVIEDSEGVTIKVPSDPKDTKRPC